MTDRSRGIWEMTIAMLISGSIGWFVLAADRPVLEVVFWRCAIGAVALALLCTGLGLFRQRLTLRQTLLAVGGGVAIVSNWLLLFASYRHASIAAATAVYNVQPFILFLLGIFFLGEKPQAAKFFWLILAFLGVTAVVTGKPTATYVPEGGNYALGLGMAFLAAFGWALAALTTKRLKGIPPQLIALIHVSVGTLMLAPLVDWQGLPQGASRWSALIALGVLHTGVMYALMYAAVQRLPTDLQGALSFIYPVVAVLVDVAVLGTQLQPLQALGMAAVVLAAAGATLGWGARRPAPAPVPQGGAR